MLFLAGLILLAVVMALAAGATLWPARWIGAVRPRLTACARQFHARIVQGRDTRSASGPAGARSGAGDVARLLRGREADGRRRC